MISTFATNPTLTEQGFTNVFRVVGRDDIQGKIAAELLVEQWGNQPIAILHDGEPYGVGLAETKRRLNERGLAETMFKAIMPGRVDYSDVRSQDGCHGHQGSSEAMSER
jgi:ABC-type branched-subunit amino acid transport system substrate-binding protein